MKIAGITPLSTLDYPNHLCLTVYTQGCNRECSYCHNKEMIPMHGDYGKSWDDIFEMIKERAHKRFIDAVVFSGGEPTLQDDLIDAIYDIKGIGLRVGLHTNGDHLTASIAANCDYILLSHQNRKKIAVASLAGSLDTSRVSGDRNHVNHIF